MCKAIFFAALAAAVFNSTNCLAQVVNQTAFCKSITSNACAEAYPTVEGYSVRLSRLPKIDGKSGVYIWSDFATDDTIPVFFQTARKGTCYEDDVVSAGNKNIDSGIVRKAQDYGLKGADKILRTFKEGEVGTKVSVRIVPAEILKGPHYRLWVFRNINCAGKLTVQIIHPDDGTLFTGDSEKTLSIEADDNSEDVKTSARDEGPADQRKWASRTVLP